MPLAIIPSSAAHVREEPQPHSSSSAVELKRLRAWRKEMARSPPSHPRFVKLVEEGVPNFIRGRVWQFLLRVPEIRQRSCVTYDALLQLPVAPAVQEAIAKDVPRTFPSDGMFQGSRGGHRKEVLLRVLQAYAVFDREVQYVQGMGVICAVLMRHLEDEEDVFWSLVAMMSTLNMHNLFTPGFPYLTELLWQLRRLLTSTVPALLQAMQEDGVDLPVVAGPWFCSVLGDSVPRGVVERLWDGLFLQGWGFFLRFVSAALHHSEHELLSMEACDMVQAVRRMSFVGTANQPLLISRALHSKSFVSSQQWDFRLRDSLRGEEDFEDWVVESPTTANSSRGDERYGLSDSCVSVDPSEPCCVPTFDPDACPCKPTPAPLCVVRLSELKLEGLPVEHGHQGGGEPPSPPGLSLSPASSRGTCHNAPKAQAQAARKFAAVTSDNLPAHLRCSDVRAPPQRPTPTSQPRGPSPAPAPPKLPGTHHSHHHRRSAAATLLRRLLLRRRSSTSSTGSCPPRHPRR
eukprot:RCo034918